MATGASEHRSEPSLPAVSRKFLPPGDRIVKDTSHLGDVRLLVCPVGEDSPRGGLVHDLDRSGLTRRIHLVHQPQAGSSSFVRSLLAGQ